MKMNHTPKRKSEKVLIELKDVWKTYRMGDISLDVLKSITLNILQGEFVAVQGPSGSGKSTLMNQIGLLDIPSRGRIVLGNIDISTLSESELAQLRGRTIGFVFQQFNLISTLTALENVILPMIFQDVPEEERAARGKALLTRVGLAERMGHRPTELSGGQQQRVAIARALVNNPEIILADEPTGNLDSKSGVQVLEILTQLHEKENKTIILVTHDAALVRYAHRIVRLKDGELVRIENRPVK
ncbi:MAG: ABC transporter ATP-binding protein [Nanoarchaeota archaeon]